MGLSFELEPILSRLVRCLQPKLATESAGPRLEGRLSSLIGVVGPGGLVGVGDRVVKGRVI